MLKFVVIALLGLSYLGDVTARRLTYGNGEVQKYYLSKGLTGYQNDETFKAAYEKAMTDFPEYKYRAGDTEFYNNYDTNEIYMSLYSRSSPHGYKIYANDVETAIRSSAYDVKKMTKIILSPKQYLNTTELVNAYLRHYTEPVNVITVHYTKFFGAPFDKYVEIYDFVAGTIAELVRELHDYGTLLDRVHLIGFGMSAHLTGGVAKMLYPYKIGRITGLDPSGGEFDNNERLGQLTCDTADFVDVISTNTRKYGTKKEHGCVNFYPNGGEIQPDSDDFTSHFKALGYFVESIARPGSFRSVKADSWPQFTNTTTLTGVYTTMGEYVTHVAYGKYYLYVNPLPPYSKDVAGEYLTGQNTYVGSRAFEMARKTLMVRFGPTLGGGFTENTKV